MTPGVNIIFLASPDEEVGGELGLGFLINHAKIRGDAVIVLDASPELASMGASGLLWGKVTVKGKQGHAGYPHLAENAIDKAIPFLQELSEYRKIRERIRSKIPSLPGSPHVWGRFSQPAGLGKVFNHNAWRWHKGEHNPRRMRS
jgi:succinyl-diaminopimelate desuccinylase